MGLKISPHSHIPVTNIPELTQGKKHSTSLFSLFGEMFTLFLPQEKITLQVEQNNSSVSQVVNVVLESRVVMGSNL